ncbi:STAS domain-containing protein [Leptothrix discophora]|uniref:STAS domain-containing protein n=1 Tax=Leptothrix discophora TaxID=89 RepID=A0ABT9G1W1_LEPDI|nr:STAS domain-containing protein [Leptothrix discophora]MDP4300443.1 STAS domain-containing protein [Leptothrix discophora]
MNMSSIDARLAEMLRSRAADISRNWRERLRQTGGNHLHGLTPETELDAEMAGLLGGLDAALDNPDDRFGTDTGHPLAIALRMASQVRAARGFTPEESLLFVQTCKEALIDTLHGHAPLRESLLPATLRIERLMDRCVLVLASAFMAAREDVIQRQTESLREVSTPVITLWDSILLLPLVGVVDSVRAQQISERLLEAIGRSEAEVTLIDVTGVPVMDTSVARHILKTVAAAEMLGTRVILTGISPSTAQTMVKLAIDLSSVPTRGSLKAGMALALTMTGRRITDAASS